MDINSLDPGSLLAIIVALPFLGALLIGLAGSYPNLREALTLATGTATFLLVLAILPSVLGGASPEITFGEPFPGLPLRFSLEPLGMLFALVASFLWVITSIYSIGYMRGNSEKKQTRFYVYFAVAIGFTLGIGFSANLLTLFVFYEMLTLSTYPLVVHAGTDNARRGGRVYLGILLTTSIAFFLPAMIWTFSVTGTLDFQQGGIFGEETNSVVGGIILLLFFFGVGKAALMPFHRWLPAAMVAPTPVSALLHAVAVVKAGVFTLLKIAVYIFGIDILGNMEARDLLLYVAGGGILLASLVAMRQNNLKARLAYSTISQLGYVTLGALLATQAGITGAGMHIAMHAFGKITLFFCAGAIYVTARKTEISDMKGLARAMPFTMTAFLIGALSIIGLPPTGGTWSKWYLMQGTLETNQLILLGVLMISSLLNIAYLLPIPVRGFFSETSERKRDTGIKEAPWPCLLAIGITAFGCLLLFAFPQALYELAAMVG